MKTYLLSICCFIIQCTSPISLSTNLQSEQDATESDNNHCQTDDSGNKHNADQTNDMDVFVDMLPQTGTPGGLCNNATGSPCGSIDYICISGVCQLKDGFDGRPCTGSASSKCLSSNSECINHICQPCGQIGQRCCNNTANNEGCYETTAIRTYCDVLSLRCAANYIYNCTSDTDCAVEQICVPFSGIANQPMPNMATVCMPCGRHGYPCCAQSKCYAERPGIPQAFCNNATNTCFNL